MRSLQQAFSSIAAKFHHAIQSLTRFLRKKNKKFLFSNIDRNCHNFAAGNRTLSVHRKKLMVDKIFSNGTNVRTLRFFSTVLLFPKSRFVTFKFPLFKMCFTITTVIEKQADLILLFI